MATTRVQLHARFRNDDGNESGATWKDSLDTNISSGDIASSDFVFRLRLNVRQTGTTSATLTARLRYSLNGGAYLQVNPNGPVMAVASANLTDDAATTQQISSGGSGFVAGKVDDVNAQCSATATMAQNRDTEHEFMLKIPAGALNNGDTLDFRIYNTNSALNTYTVTPRLTIVNSGLAVGRGGISSWFEQTGGSNLDITDLTVGTQSNKAIVVAISWTDGGPPSTPSVTFDPSGVNQAFTLIKYQINGTGRAASLYGLVAPGATGNKTVRIACGGSNFACFAGAVQYFNVDQTGGTTTFANAAGNTGSGTTVSLSITSAVGCKTVDCFGAATPSGVPTQPLLWFSTGAGAEDGGSSEGVGASSVTHQWTITTNNWAVAGCSVAVYSAAVDISGDGVSAAAGTTSAAAGEQQITGSGTAETAGVTSSGSGEQRITGAVTSATTNATSQGSGEQRVTGAGTSSASGSTSQASGEQTVQGTVGSSASGTNSSGVGAIPEEITGTGQSASAGTTSQGSGIVPYSGTGANTAGQSSSIGSGELTHQASGGSASANTTSNGQGIAGGVFGTGASAGAGATSGGSGQQKFEATAISSASGATSQGQGGVPNTGVGVSASANTGSLGVGYNYAIPQGGSGGRFIRRILPRRKEEDRLPISGWGTSEAGKAACDISGTAEARRIDFYFPPPIIGTIRSAAGRIGGNGRGEIDKANIRLHKTSRMLEAALRTHPKIKVQVKATLKQIQELEDVGAREFVQIFNRLREQVVLSIAQAGLDPVTARAVKAEIDGKITDYANRLKEELTTYQRRAFIKGIQLVDNTVKAGDILLGIPFMSEKTLEQVQAFGGELITELTNFARQKIVQTIDLSVMGQRPMEQTLEEIGRNLKGPSVFGTIARRANTIFRTEVNRIGNLAAAERLKQARQQVPDLKKQWMHSHVGIPRPGHLALDGVAIPVNEKFELVGEDGERYLIGAPHEPSLPAGEVINCKCQIIPVVGRFQRD